MARKQFTTEQIIGLLREAEVRLSQGQAIGTCVEAQNACGSLATLAYNCARSTSCPSQTARSGQRSANGLQRSSQ